MVTSEKCLTAVLFVTLTEVKGFSSVCMLPQYLSGNQLPDHKITADCFIILLFVQTS